MAKRSSKGKSFQLALIGVCLVISFLSANSVRAESITSASGPKAVTGLDALQPIYFTPEQMKEMGPVMTFLKPITPFNLAPSSIPQPKPLTELPDWMKIGNK
jgi:hypothetical protein